MGLSNKSETDQLNDFNSVLSDSKYFGTLEDKQRKKISLYRVEGVSRTHCEKSWYNHDLRAVLAQARELTNFDGKVRKVTDHEGYIEYIHPTSRKH